MRNSIEPYIFRKIVVLHETASALEAAKAMSVHGIGSVIVSDTDGHMTGIVTDRDLARRLVANGWASAETKLSEIMSVKIVSVDEDSSMEDVLDLMEEHGIRRIPVIQLTKKSGREKCIGLISLDDLMAAEDIATARLGRIIRAQICRRHGLGLAGREVSAGQFVSELADETGLGGEDARELARFVFSALARRLNYSSAVQFALELPSEFQDELFDLSEPAGPDRSVTEAYLVRELSDLLEISPENARRNIQILWQVLKRFGDKNQLRHAFCQLPADIQNLLFEMPPSPLRREFEDWM